MNIRSVAMLGVAAAIVAGVILSLQGFDAEKVSCDAIGEARANLQALYDTGVEASVQAFAEEKAAIDERLSQCLSAKPVDPCAAAQSARDAAVERYNGIPSPTDGAPYAEFQQYFMKREEAYADYRKAKEALDQCRAANPPKGDVPYEQSDTKACFDSYDASVEAARTAFNKNTGDMRAALNAGLAALDAREKACHPPTGKEKFTQPPREGGVADGTSVPIEIMNCKLINPDADTELFSLRARAAALPSEIESAQTSIDNINKRMAPLKRDLAEVDTYIPPESTRTQYEGALNALRAERKVAIESSLDFYADLLERRRGETEALQQELRDVNARIQARLEQIRKENEARQRAYPTALHLAKPDKCAYYHCHGMLCGRSDPAPDGCGQGATAASDIDCRQFFDSYLQEAGVR